MAVRMAQSEMTDVGNDVAVREASSAGIAAMEINVEAP